MLIEEHLKCRSKDMQNSLNMNKDASALFVPYNKVVVLIAILMQVL